MLININNISNKLTSRKKYISFLSVTTKGSVEQIGLVLKFVYFLNNFSSIFPKI